MSAGGAWGTILELREVAKTYPGEPPIQALHAVSLTIQPGELLAAAMAAFCLGGGGGRGGRSGLGRRPAVFA